VSTYYFICDVVTSPNEPIKVYRESNGSSGLQETEEPIMNPDGTFGGVLSPDGLVFNGKKFEKCGFHTKSVKMTRILYRGI